MLFFKNEKLCMLQLKYGEKYISNVCRTYPRKINIFNDIIEMSADASCPIIAELMLIPIKPMEFDFLEETNLAKNKSICGIIYNDKNYSENQPERYLWNLRNFTIDLLENRKFCIIDRLNILGLFCNDIDNLIQTNKAKYILSLISLYYEKIEQNTFKVYHSILVDKIKSYIILNTIKQSGLRSIFWTQYFYKLDVLTKSSFAWGVRYSIDP